MKNHQQIDQRSLVLARAIAAKLDADPSLLAMARSVCSRWHTMNAQHATGEWLDILQRPWAEIRQILLDESETGQRLRQNSPFCGILTPLERWAIYEEFARDEKKAT